jgi:hypothetical protein
MLLLLAFGVSNIAIYAANKAIEWKRNRAVMKSTLIAVALVAVGMPAHAGGDMTTARLIAHWNDENTNCRGGHGDDPATDIACGRREVWSGLLKRAGCRYHMGDYWVCRK